MGPLVLFDLDDTLIDREATFARWARAFAAERGLDDAAVGWLCEADRFGYAPRDALFAEARDALGLDEGVDELVAAYRVAYPAHFAPEPAVLDALDRLRAEGWRVAVVTNGPALQHDKLARAELTSRVDAVCVSAEVGVAKPDPRIFRAAVERAGGPGTGRVPVMVGDNPDNDIAGAAALGFATVWVHRGRPWPAAAALTPDAACATVPEAAALLLGGGPEVARR